MRLFGKCWLIRVWSFGLFTGYRIIISHLVISIIANGLLLTISRETLSLNPLLHTGHYCVRMTKIFDFKIRRDHQKISYGRRVYESVDDSSLS